MRQALLERATFNENIVGPCNGDHFEEDMLSPDRSGAFGSSLFMLGALPCDEEAAEVPLSPALKRVDKASPRKRHVPA